MGENQEGVPKEVQKIKVPDDKEDKTKKPWDKEAAREKAETRMKELVGQIGSKVEELGLGGVKEGGSEVKAFLDEADEEKRDDVNFSHSFMFSDVPGVGRKGLPTVGCHIFVSDSHAFGPKETIEYGLFPNRDDNPNLKTDSLEDAIALYKQKYG